MISLSSTLAGLAAAAALVQQALPSAPAPTAADDEAAAETARVPDGPLTWESLPEALRTRLEAVIGRPIPQAAVVVDAPETGDAGTRRVDHGAIVVEQTVRPAAFATIVTPARNARKYGAAGAVLWRAIGDGGDWWCWRDDERFPHWRWPSNIYCYQDGDGDGAFDQVMENSGADDGFVFDSRYQFRALGREHRLRDVVGYRIDAESADRQRYVEKIVVRYDGPSSGRVQADGRLTDGEIVFDLLTGSGAATSPEPRRGNPLVRIIPGPPDDGLTEIDKLIVKLDAEGRGRLADARGVVLEVERANVDGSADIRLLSGLREGETLLFPPPTRETFLAMLEALREARGAARP